MATLDAYPDWKIPCKVIAIIPTADRQKSTVKVRVGFDKLDPRILPEMSVKVGFRDTETSGPGGTIRAVLVPREAVVDVVVVVGDLIGEVGDLRLQPRLLALEAAEAHQLAALLVPGQGIAYQR